MHEGARFFLLRFLFPSQPSTLNTKAKAKAAKGIFAFFGWGVFLVLLGTPLAEKSPKNKKRAAKNRGGGGRGGGARVAALFGKLVRYTPVCH
jgi:hypothetical protein